MSQPALLDFDALLADISEAQPCGSSKDAGDNVALVYAFSELRDLTSVARKIEAKRYELAALSPKERQGFLVNLEGKSDGPQADPKWSRIADLAIQILTKHSKDTRVMVSLAEAMPRIGGLPGLRDGLKVCADLIEKYKLALYPQPEAGEPPHQCLAALAQLAISKNMESAIDQAEIFQDASGFSWYSHLAAMRIEKLASSEKDKDRQEAEQCIQDGQISLDAFKEQLEIADASALENFDREVESI